MRLLTQTQAADALGISKQAISNAIRRGALKTVEVAKGVRLIDHAEVERYRKQVSARYEKL